MIFRRPAACVIALMLTAAPIVAAEQPTKKKTRPATSGEVAKKPAPKSQPETPKDRPVCSPDAKAPGSAGAGVNTLEDLQGSSPDWAGILAQPQEAGSGTPAATPVVWRETEPDSKK